MIPKSMSLHNMSTTLSKEVSQIYVRAVSAANAAALLLRVCNKNREFKKIKNKIGPNT